MGWFSSNNEADQNGDTKNTIKIDNTNTLDVISDEILIVLIVIAVIVYW